MRYYILIFDIFPLRVNVNDNNKCMCPVRLLIITFNVAISVDGDVVGGGREEGAHLREVSDEVSGEAVGRDVGERDVGFLNGFSNFHFLVKRHPSWFYCIPHSCWVHPKF